MKLYAELPARRTLQIVADALLLCWVALWIWAGRTANASVLQLQAPAQNLENAGVSFRTGMTDAGSALAKVPFVGDTLRTPFDSLSQAGGQVSEAGQNLQDGVARVASITGLVVTLLPVILVAVVWLYFRVRYIRRASQAARFRSTPGALELLALRALTNGDLDDLTRISPDPAGAWRHRDFPVVHRLAELELRSLGLSPQGLSGPAASAPQVAHGGPPRV